MLLTGQGTATSQISSEEFGGGGSGSSGVDVKDEGVLVLASATTLNFVGAGVAAAVDGVIPTQVNVTIDGGLRTVTSSASIDANALIKVSGTNTYAMLGAADDAVLCVGVAVTGVVGAGSFTAQFIPGTITTMLSDGTGAIANGAAVVPSTTVAGRIKTGTTNTVGVNVGAAVAATLNLTVSVL